MAFKDSTPQFQIIDVSIIDADPAHVRQTVNDEALKGLVNAIQKVGILQPIVVRPSANGRFVVILGERRRQAAIKAGQVEVPVLIRNCTDEEALEVRVFENIGLGVRSALEPRDMANAIESIAARFDSPDEAARYFGRSPTWLTQATAAAKLSDKVSALLDSGKITSTSTAVQLEKLAKRNEAKAESLIEKIEQLPEGEKVSKKVVDGALLEETGRTRKAPEPSQIPQPVPVALLHESAEPVAVDDIPPWEEIPRATTVITNQNSAHQPKVNPGKVKLVAELLGLSDDDEEEILARLIDEFLALKGARELRVN